MVKAASTVKNVRTPQMFASRRNERRGAVEGGSGDAD